MILLVGVRHGRLADLVAVDQGDVLPQVGEGMRASGLSLSPKPMVMPWAFLSSSRFVAKEIVWLAMRVLPGELAGYSAAMLVADA